MSSGKETKTGQFVVPRFLFVMMFACLLSIAGQSACFATTVTLQWDSVTDPNLAGYKVYYQANSSTQPFEGTGATQGASPITFSNVTTATISGLNSANAYYFAVTTLDSSGNESAYSNIVTVAEYPTVSVTAPANNSSVSGTVSVTASASDSIGVSKVEFYVNGTLQSTDVSTPYLYSWNTASLAAGSYTLMAMAYNAAGNAVQSANVSVNVAKDTTAPKVSVTAPANNATVSGTTTITASASDNVGVTKVEFYENGILLTATNVSPYSYNWNTATLTNGASYTLSAKAYDAAGNVGQSSNVSVTVNNAEVNNPSGTVLITQGNYTNKTAVTLNLTASDAYANVAAYCISNTNTCTTWTKLATPVTPLAITAKQWTLAAGANGNRTVNVWFKDVLGNVSAPASAAITLDTTAPVNGTLTPAQLAGNQIQLAWAGFSDATSGIASYKLVRGTTLPAASCTGAAIYTPAATDTTYTDTGSQGVTYYYRLCAVDNAGNISTGATTPAVMAIPEVNKPSGTVSINQGNYTNNAITLGSYTNKPAVKLNLTASDAYANVAAYCISNTNTCTKWTKLATPVTPFSTTTALAWTLAAGADGNRTVNVWYKDVWGNVSAPASAATMLDTKAPVNGTLTPAQLAGNQIQLGWTGFSDATSGITSYKLVRGTTLPAASCTGAAIYTPAATDTTYTDTGAQGVTYYYRLCAVDNAGNISTGATTPAVMAIPEVNKPSGTVSINQGNYTSKAAVTLNLTASDAYANVAAYCISNTNMCTTWTKLTTPVTPFSTTTALAWTLAAGADGNRTVNVWYKDVWGNVSAPASATIILDTTAPVNGTLAINSTFTLSWNGFSDATSGIASYVLARDTKTYPACSTASAVIYSGSQTSFNDRSGRHSTSGTTYYYRLCAVDNAGNISKGATTSMKTP